MTSQHQTGVLAATTLLFTAASAFAADLNVPGDFATITGAVAAATAGDTVIVGPGVYNENGITIDKTLLIVSTGGAAATTVDAGGSGRCFNFISGGDDSELRGFTLTGGDATQGGGGLQIGDGAAGVIVADCIIRDNNSNVNGGGARVRGEDARFLNCLFLRNTAGTGGGAVRVANPPASALFVNCIFNANEAIDGGGGLEASGDGTSVEVINCTFTRNAGSNVGVSNCCQANGTPGCDWQSCQNTVCDEDPFCCDTQWDQLCADHAIDLCGACGPSGGSINAVFESTVTVANSIVRIGGSGGEQVVDPSTGATLTITYSNIQGFYPGAGNIDDPGPFVDGDGPDDIIGTLDDDFRLKINGGGTVDGGDTSAAIGLMVANDFYGGDRVVNQPDIVDNGVPVFGTIDMGAAEAQLTPAVDPCPADLNNDGVVNAGDLAVLLAAWGACP